MSEVVHLVGAIKRLLKASGLTYRDVAASLGLSEASVKRLFSTERLTVDRLAQISELLGYTMAELLQACAQAVPQVRTLTEAQEAKLVGDASLLLVAVCALNHWSVADIVATYRFTQAECVKRLLQLDRMGVIALLPGDRIRPRVARDFDWLPDGPIRRYFRAEGLPEFLGAPFDGVGEAMEFAHGMLTRAAQAELQRELRRFKARLAALHEECTSAPLADRHGTSMMLAMRPWTPSMFAKLLRPE